MGKETMNKNSREEMKLVTVTAGQSGNRLEFKLRGLPATDFCEFVEKSEKQDVIIFFREIVKYLEVQRNIMDFHLKIHEVGPSFVVEVFYGDKRDGPEEVDSGTLNSSPTSVLTTFLFGLEVILLNEIDLKRRVDI